MHYKSHQALPRLLSSYDFPGDDIPIVVGSALKALEGDASEIGVPAIEKLVETMDSYIPEPVRNEREEIHLQFLERLKKVIPIHLAVTVVTDAGFHRNWFEQVIALGWQVIGRIYSKEKKFIFSF